MRAKRRKLGVLLAIVLAGAALVLLCHRSREPVYEGRKLSTWCIDLSQSSSAEERTRAAEAIRQIGTNAPPHLLQWISYDPSRWRDSLYIHLNRLAKPLGRTWVIREAITNTLRRIDPQALDSLDEIGGLAVPATMP